MIFTDGGFFQLMDQLENVKFLNGEKGIDFEGCDPIAYLMDCDYNECVIDVELKDFFVTFDMRMSAGQTKVNVTFENFTLYHKWFQRDEIELTELEKDIVIGKVIQNVCFDDSVEYQGVLDKDGVKSLINKCIND